MEMDTIENNQKPTQDVSIVAAEPKHLDQMTQCHIKAFPGEFTTLIGKRFIKGSYRFYITDPDGIVFVAVSSSGEVVGLVSGGKPELRRQFSVKRVPLYSLDIVFSAIKNRYVRKRLCQHFCTAAKKIVTKLKPTTDNVVTEEPAPGPAGTWSSLLSICSEPQWRGRGIGKALMEAFRSESAARGYKTMRLSVHLDNDAAIALYKKCGWQVILETKRGIYFKRSVEE